MNIANKLIINLNDLILLKNTTNLSEQIINITLKNIPYPDKFKKSLILGFSKTIPVLRTLFIYNPAGT